MNMRPIDEALMAELAGRARQSPRQRQHLNLHASYDERCQRLLNALEPGTYIRPHRHSLDPKQETLIALRGELALVLFDEAGAVVSTTRFGAGDAHGCHGVDLSPGAWHTVLALREGSVLFEVKAGPFDPAQAKEMAPWAPDEGSAAAVAYLQALRQRVD